MNIEPEVLKYLYTQMDVGVIVHNKEFDILYGNNAAQNILGLSIEVLKKMDKTNLDFSFFNEVDTLLTHEDMPYYKALTSRDIIKNYIIRIQHSDNSFTRWMNASSFPINLDHTSSAVVTTFYDISDKKEAATQLIKNEKFLQLILDNIPQFIFWKNNDLVYQGCNLNFAKAAGVVTPENIVGKTDYDLAWKQEQMESFRRDDQTVMDNKEPWLHIIESQYQADGKEAWLETNKIPLIEKNGDVTGVLGTFQDITELIEAKQKIEDMLRTENERLELLIEERTQELQVTMQELMNSEKLASLGSLVAGVSHEINTPLGVSITAASYLEDINKDAYTAITSGKFSKNDLIKYMKSIDETSHIVNSNLYRAAELVKSFKEISINHNTEISSKFDIRHYTESLILTLKHEYKNTPHRLELKPDEPVWIKSYPSDFSQILTNLIMNSLIHAFTNEKPGVITITLEKKNNHFLLLFKDNGKGISPDDLVKIFDPFFTTNRKNGGTGLGLNISYNIVTEKLKGTIKCESSIGEGSLFIIKIPLGDEHD